jgi:hypothetical protein
MPRWFIPHFLPAPHGTSSAPPSVRAPHFGGHCFRESLAFDSSFCTPLQEEYNESGFCTIKLL